jgi:uncharacterized protein with HEPN domain
MSPSGRELLLHFLDETAYLLSACDQLSQADFLSDPTLKRDFTRSLEIIDRLVHHYFGIDYEMVWGVVTAKVVSLDHAVRACLEQLDKQ